LGRLEGKKALVTGGSRSIGRACALGLAKEGADVGITYVSNSEAAAETVGSITALGRQSKAYKANSSRLTEVQRAVDEFVSDFGRIDILVNNAGILRRTPFLDISEEEWDLIMGTNLKGYFLVGQTAAKKMVKNGGGVIINMSSAGQELAAPNLTHYCTAKAGVAMLTKQMALELAPHHIRVNAVAPGLVETDLNRKDIANPEFRERRMARIPLKIIAKPEDVAATIVFLASEDSKLSTGQTVFLDAGANIWGA
jgi:NAD(P)-dependent dehydrogenase (short-subunit alcohol dehydrogenase family)